MVPDQSMRCSYIKEMRNTLEEGEVRKGKSRGGGLFVVSNGGRTMSMKDRPIVVARRIPRAQWVTVLHIAQELEPAQPSFKRILCRSNLFP